MKNRNLDIAEEELLGRQVMVRRRPLRGHLYMVHVFAFEDTRDVILKVSGNALKTWMYLMLTYCGRGGNNGRIFLRGAGTRETCRALKCSRQTLGAWMDQLVKAGLIRKVAQGDYFCERKHGVTLHVTAKVINA